MDDDGWVVREEGDLALAGQVRGYQREENGRPQTVRPYHRLWWVPHPDWEKGEQRWITAGEAKYDERGKAAEAKGKAARAGERPGATGSAAGGTGEKAVRSAERGTAVDVSPHLGTQGRPEHGYLDPDPERLARERGTYKRPEDHPFFQKNPMTPEAIVKAYDDSTPGEKNQGLRWYADGHRLAWALGGGDAELGAKVLSAYSPRTGWPLNMFNAARSLAEGRALGPGEGTIMGQHQKAAAAAMAGGDIDTVFPSPKTNAFARLLALGEDHPDDPHGAVVIDRHALSVAAGRRLTKADTEGKGENGSPIGKSPYYDHVADQYRQAARQLSDREGQEIAPHQVQAITWLRQQRLNTVQDLASEKGNAGLVTASRNQWSAWQKYASAHDLRTELGTTALPPTPITKAEARGDSRPVSAAEFNDVASRGRDLLNGLEANTSPITGMVGNWASLQDSAWQQVQQPWGGMTIDAHTGEPLPADADKYALSVKPPGVSSMSVPEDASQEQFQAAMNEALVKYRSILEQGSHYLGIFHDDENHRIDIDPVVVTDSRDDAEAIGAYTHNVGGAFRFSDGNGYFPPHIDELRGVEPRRSADGGEKLVAFLRGDDGGLA